MEIIVNILCVGVSIVVFFFVGTVAQTFSESDSPENKKEWSFLKTLVVGALIIIPILYIGNCAGCGGSDDMSWSIQKGK